MRPPYEPAAIAKRRASHTHSANGVAARRPDIFVGLKRAVCALWTSTGCVSLRSVLLAHEGRRAHKLLRHLFTSACLPGRCLLELCQPAQGSGWQQKDMDFPRGATSVMTAVFAAKLFRATIAAVLFSFVEAIKPRAALPPCLAGARASTAQRNVWPRPAARFPVMLRWI